LRLNEKIIPKWDDRLLIYTYIGSEFYMDINLFKTFLDEVGIGANVKEPINQEEKMLMELWEHGSKEEQNKLAHTLLEMMIKTESARRIER